MSISNLSKEDLQVVGACLEIIASGEVIEHDWEFETIMGVSVESFMEFLRKWPEINESESATRELVNNAFVSLLGYPHRYHDDWASGIPFSRDRIESVFSKWKSHGADGDLKETT